MSRDEHAQARELIACGEPSLADSQQTWLQAHLRDCEECSQYRQKVGAVVRALRSAPIAADRGLVEATQMRVRSHAQQLRQKQERLWLVWMSCVLVGLSAAVTTPLLWRGWEWLGEGMRVANSVWQVGFSIFWIAPALAVSVLLLARGTHLENTHGKSEG